MKLFLCIIVAMVATTFVSAASADSYGGNSRSEQAYVTRLIYQTFGTGWRGQTMLCIARRESGLNPRAANWHDSHGGSFGLFQINGVHDPSPGSYATQAWIGKMLNPVENVRMAARLARGGLGPWGGGC